MSRVIQRQSDVPDDIKQLICDTYKELVSVKGTYERLQQMDLTVYPTYPNIKTLVTNEGLFQGFASTEYRQRQGNRMRSSMQERYGVDNPSQLKPNQNIQNNKIAFETFDWSTNQLADYKYRVERKTRQNVNKMDAPYPSYCEYTGIRFIDDIQEQVNPNDPRKRTKDHIVPVIECFLRGWSVDEAAALNNTAFVLKVVNSIKANTRYDEFVPLANIIREKCINEGFESN